MSSTTLETPITLGMRLDTLIDQINSLSPTQLYTVTVLSSLLACFLLLPKSPRVPPPSQPISTKGTPTPEPKWYILNVLNGIAAISFIVSVIVFMSDASVYLSDSFAIVKFLCGWSVFLCYFFGFFGISFVDAEMLQEEEDDESPVAPTTKSKTSTSKSRIHPPAQSIHPVCSSKPSSTTTSTSSTSTEDLSQRSNDEIAQLVISHQIKDHTLEKRFDTHRAVEIRRLAFDHKLSSLGNASALSSLPYQHSLDYSSVYGANCEIVVGYVPLPVGMVGPVTLNNESVYIPMATTEGCLVASTNRGCKAISQGGSGAHSRIVKDGITRAPCLRLPSAMAAADMKAWCETPVHFQRLKAAFESTTSFGKLTSCAPTVAGKNVYLRLTCVSGDAMGMNMVSKGSLAVIDVLQREFPSMVLVALSGNMCTDKKAAAMNWIEGRGKSVVIETTISKKVVETILKTSVGRMVSTNYQKNLIGSAMAGSMGGFNAHASNNVTAVFLATGQDPAQNVESSNCITLVEETTDGDLWMSCTMPSIEVGTVGGGTSLAAQAACLKAIGCQGGNSNCPGGNAKKLAQVVAAATMAGELSLLAALAANELVSAHMQHNRKPAGKK